MENASKALIMAASVLLGVMLISIAVFLFSTFSDYSAESYKKIEQAKIDEFNSRFLKFYGTRINETTNNVEPILCTAHDIASLANLAKQNNEDYQLTDKTKNYDKNTYYITIRLQGINDYKNKKLEQLTDKEQIDFIQKYSLKTTNHDNDNNNKFDEETLYFKCTKVSISESTKRVYEVVFAEYIP